MLRTDGGTTMADRPVNHVLVPLFLLEVTVTSCLAVIFYYLKYLDNFHQRRYPLACADVLWISYPYYDSPSSVPLFLDGPALYSACFFIPAVTVTLMEIIRWFFYEGEKKVMRVACPRWDLHFFPRRVVRILGTLLFGMLATDVLTFTLKYLLAVPRPHFLQACQPNASALTDACGGDIYTGAVAANATFTPSAATCLAAAHRVDAALRSLPSERAALAAFCGAFLAAYLHKMAAFRRLRTVRPCLVALCALGGVVPGVGSLHAFHCRWADVVAGYLLGVGVALYLTEISLRGFADVRVPTAATANLLSLSQPVGADGFSGFKSVPSVATVEAEKAHQAAMLDGPGPPGIPRARSNALTNLLEASNNSFFTEPRGGFVNHAYNGQHVDRRGAY